MRRPGTTSPVIGPGPGRLLRPRRLPVPLLAAHRDLHDTGPQVPVERRGRGHRRDRGGAGGLLPPPPGRRAWARSPRPREEHEGRIAARREAAPVGLELAVARDRILLEDLLVGGTRLLPVERLDAGVPSKTISSKRPSLEAKASTTSSRERMGRPLIASTATGPLKPILELTAWRSTRISTIDLAVRLLGLLRLAEQLVPHQVPVGVLGPVAAEHLQQLGVEGHEDEAGVDDVAGRHVVSIAHAVVAGDAAGGGGELELGPVAPDREASPSRRSGGGRRGSGRSPGHRRPPRWRRWRWRWPSTARRTSPGSTTPSAVPPGTTRFTTAPLRSGGQPPLAAVGRREERAGLETGVREPVVGPVVEVLEEVPDHGDGDEEAHVVEAGEALEGHPDHPAVLHHRPPAVAGVDGGVGLDHEVGVGPAVDVAPHLDAGDDACGGRDVLSARGGSRRSAPASRCAEARPGRAAGGPRRRWGRRRSAPRGRSRGPRPRRWRSGGWPGRDAAPGSAARRPRRGRW